MQLIFYLIGFGVPFAAGVWLGKNMRDFEQEKRDLKRDFYRKNKLR